MAYLKEDKNCYTKNCVHLGIVVNNNHSLVGFSEKLDQLIKHSYRKARETEQHRTLELLYQDRDFTRALVERLNHAQDEEFSQLVPNFLPYLFDVVSSKEMIGLLSLVEQRRQSFPKTYHGEYFRNECSQALVGYFYYMWDHKDHERLKDFFQTDLMVRFFEQESHLVIRDMVSDLIVDGDKEMLAVLLQCRNGSDKTFWSGLRDEASMWSEAFHHESVGAMEVLLGQDYIKQEENAFFTFKMIGDFNMINEKTTHIVRKIASFIGDDYILDQDRNVNTHLRTFYSLLNENRQKEFLKKCLGHSLVDKWIAYDDDFGKALLHTRISLHVEDNKDVAPQYKKKM